MYADAPCVEIKKDLEVRVASSGVSRSGRGSRDQGPGSDFIPNGEKSFYTSMTGRKNYAIAVKLRS